MGVGKYCHSTILFHPGFETESRVRGQASDSRPQNMDG